MILNIKMCRFESIPWGFRLVGGSDFEYPLTVVKVTEGSIAEEAGLKVGDVIVRINDEPSSQLTHNQVHEVILNCGNGFFFGVNREEENEGHLSPCEAEVEQIFSPISPVPETNYSVTSGSPSENRITSNDDGEDKSNDKKISDEEIAELISSEAEVLKEHNVIGIFPKPGVCMSSQVLRTLNDEAMKTRKEREKDKRKWTTFMQKPDRPIPKSKREIEEEIKAKHTTSYTLVIKKQPQPKVAPGHVPTPPPSPIPEKVTVEEKPAVEEPVAEEDIAPLTDSEVPDLQPLNDLDDEKQIINGVNENQIEDDRNQNREAEYDLEDQNQVNDTEQNEIFETKDEPEDISKITEKTEEELALEKQLQDVQKQLLALSSLPSTIQATLDAVTRQLAELLPTFKLQQGNISTNQNNFEQEKAVETEPVPESEIDDTNEYTQNASFSETENEICSEKESDQLDEIARAIKEEEEEQQEFEREEKRIQQEELERKLNEEEKISQEIDHKKQQKEVFMDELQQRQKSRSKKGPSRPFGPLVPQTRPLILPGGRKWRTPKDAFNEEFIAETLSSQAELIVGTTLGSTYESPLLGYDEREVNCASLAIQLDKRVNFLKFQKPEKKIDLDRSEVYKVIHHMDRQPKRGIEVRPAKVPAEEDIRNKIQCG